MSSILHAVLFTGLMFFFSRTYGICFPIFLMVLLVGDWSGVCTPGCHRTSTQQENAIDIYSWEGHGGSLKQYLCILNALKYNLNIKTDRQKTLWESPVFPFEKNDVQIQQRTGLDGIKGSFWFSVPVTGKYML